MDEAAATETYLFGDFRMDAGRRILCTASTGTRVAIAPKVFDAGLYFIRHAGELLAKQRLLDHLWPGVVVEENCLTQTVSDLRRALGEGRGDHRYVVTVPRRGYQFVAPVQRLGSAGQPGLPYVRALAVLPFENLTGHARDGVLATALAETIRHRLAGVPNLRVVAAERTAMPGLQREDDRRLGRRLGAAARWLLQGNLQRSGERLRIVIRLVDLDDGAHVWSLRFDHATGADTFAVEDEVAERVAQALGDR